MNITLHILNGLAIVATAVVFGTDVFFALVGKKAIAKSKDASIADVMGNIHSVADARMPLFGVTAIVSTLLQVILGRFNLLAILALIGLLIHLLIYFKISKPINTIMTEGIKFGRVITNIRELQQRWDRLIGLRAGLLLITLVSLVLIHAFRL